MKINEIYGNSYNKRLKSISSTGKSMFIDFEYQYEHSDENLNLIALIKYKKFNFDCQTWLDANKNILMSPNSPSNTNCSWMLSANFGSYIILNFTFIEVNSYSWMILITGLKVIVLHLPFNRLRMSLNTSRFMKAEVNMETL